MKAIEILKLILKEGLDNCMVGTCNTFDLRDMRSWTTWMFRAEVTEGLVYFNTNYLYSYSDSFSEMADATLLDEYGQTIWLVPIE